MPKSPEWYRHMIVLLERAAADERLGELTKANAGRCARLLTTANSRRQKLLAESRDSA